MLLIVASTAALIQASARGLLLGGAQYTEDLENFTRELERFSAEVDAELRRQEQEGLLRQAGAAEEDAGPEEPVTGAQAPGGETYAAQRAASLLSSTAVALAKEMQALKGRIRRRPSELPQPRASVLQFAATGARQAPGGEGGFLPPVVAAAPGPQATEGGPDPFLPPPDAARLAELAAAAREQQTPNSNGAPSTTGDAASGAGDAATSPVPAELPEPHSTYKEGHEHGLHLASTVKVVATTLLVIGAVLLATMFQCRFSSRDARARRQCQWLL